MPKEQTSYQLPDLPYDYGDLEPVISAKIMQLHHQKHHAAYVQNLNKSLEEYHEAESKKDVGKLVSLQENIRFNGGGHINHALFWTILCPPKMARKEPPKELAEAINKDFGSFSECKKRFEAAAGAVKGSGWGWLGWSKQEKKLKIATTANQDPLSTLGLFPIFGVDVWEHAYYLQYENRRPEYLKVIWDVLHWEEIAHRWKAVL